MRLSWALRRPRKRPSCARCRTPWRYWRWCPVRPHITSLPARVVEIGIFVICRKCWKEVRAQDDTHIMLSWYLEAVAVQADLVRWPVAQAAVLQELRKG